MTLWELYELVAKKLNRSPIRISFAREKQSLPQLGPSAYHQTLESLKLENDEEIGVDPLTKKKERVPLYISATCQLSMQASAVFESWFDKYSGENEDKPGQRVMTPETAVEYVRTCAREKPAGMSIGVGW
jgi:hypothetical protein